MLVSTKRWVVWFNWLLEILFQDVLAIIRLLFLLRTIVYFPRSSAIPCSFYLMLPNIIISTSLFWIFLPISPSPIISIYAQQLFSSYPFDSNLIFVDSPIQCYFLRSWAIFYFIWLSQSSPFKCIWHRPYSRLELFFPTLWSSVILIYNVTSCQIYVKIQYHLLYRPYPNFPDLPSSLLLTFPWIILNLQFVFSTNLLCILFFSPGAPNIMQ
jgi:hypothetical protein